ncbi:MAG: TolC family protein [Candidatus Riflebacteria bacterium]|nr:TolC family protein [Candidatus Riflebacteria bacterium]
MKVSRNIRLVAALFLFIGIGSLSFAKTLRVGIVFDGPSDNTLNFVHDIEEELPNTLLPNDKVVFPSDSRVAGKFDVNKIKAGLSQLMINKNVDAVLAIGPVASHLAANLDNYQKPVIAAHIYNASMQKIKQKNGSSGVKNLSYIDMNLDIGQHIDKYQEIKTFKKLHLLMSPYMLKGIPQLADSLKIQTNKAGVELKLLPSNIKAGEIANSLKDAEAVYVAPLPDLPDEHQCMLIARINELKIPTMAMFGKETLKCGVLCTIATGIDTEKLSRRLANNLSRVLYKEDLSTFPTAFSHNQRLTINMETCRKVGIYPNFSAMTTADIVNEEEQVARKISITQAIETALVKNLSKIAKRLEIEANIHAIDKARAALVPRGNIYFRQVEIDDDRAQSIFTPAEHATHLGTNLRYLIVSEDAKANIDVQKFFLAAKKDEERGLMLDIIQKAAVSYLNVLKAKTLKNIQEDNLAVTRANLEIAKQRESVGTAAPAEVYRWEIQMATARQAVIEADATKRKSELALNEALSNRQDEPFNTLEEDIFSNIFFFDYDRIAPYIDNIQSFDCFSNFLVEDSFAFSPEIAAVNKNLEATARMRRAHRRRRQFRPTVDISANFDRTFEKAGDGKSKPNIPDINLPLKSYLHPDKPFVRDVNLPLSSMFKFPDDNDWSVALSLTFPLFDGAQTGAALREADKMLDALRTRRDDLMQKHELQTRVALENAKTSFISIKMSRQRVEYAEKALEAVRNAYSRGAINILDLIDAQNAYRIAKEANANAVFTFLSDFIQVCRSVGTFDFILNQRTNQEYYSRIEDYFKIHNIKPAYRSFKGEQYAD